MIPCPKADLHDPAYLKYWQDLCRLGDGECFATGVISTSVVGHHVRGRRRFGDKWNIVPLDFMPHQLWHQNPAKFVEKYGITKEDMQAEATRLYDAWRVEYDEWAPFLVNAP